MIPPDNSRNFDRSGEFERLNRKETAYHEAAHAIIHCLFGEGDCIDTVMLYEEYGDELGKTYLKLGHAFILGDIPLLQRAPIPDDVVRRTVARHIVNCFAGLAAEQKLAVLSRDTDSELHDETLKELGLYNNSFVTMQWYESLELADLWYVNLFDENYDGFGARTDFELAAGSARLLVGANEEEIQLFLDECAIITDRLVNDPVVWSCINSLAKELLEKATMLGSHIDDQYSEGLADFDLSDELIMNAAEDCRIEGPHRFGFTIRHSVLDSDSTNLEGVDDR